MISQLYVKLQNTSFNLYTFSCAMHTKDFIKSFKSNKTHCKRQTNKIRKYLIKAINSMWHLISPFLRKCNDLWNRYIYVYCLIIDLTFLWQTLLFSPTYQALHLSYCYSNIQWNFFLNKSKFKLYIGANINRRLIFVWFKSYGPYLYCHHMDTGQL